MGRKIGALTWRIIKFYEEGFSLSEIEEQFKREGKRVNRNSVKQSVHRHRDKIDWTKREKRKKVELRNVSWSTKSSRRRDQFLILYGWDWFCDPRKFSLERAVHVLGEVSGKQRNISNRMHRLIERDAIPNLKGQLWDNPFSWRFNYWVIMVSGGYAEKTKDYRINPARILIDLLALSQSRRDYFECNQVAVEYVLEKTAENLDTIGKEIVDRFLSYHPELQIGVK